MSMTFKDLQDEVKRRATRDQAGGNYDVAVKNLVNNSLFRIANETPWRPLRRENYFDTLPEFSTGTVSATPGSKSITFVGSNLITNGIITNRHIKINTGSRTLFKLASITGENAATLDEAYDGTVAVTNSGYIIYGQEVYNLPIQCGRVGMIWHEGFDVPYAMEYVTNRAFIESGCDWDDSDTPVAYWMWGEDWVITQPRQSSVLSVSSSTVSDTGTITIFGTVSGYPDSEIISYGAVGIKLFSSVERVVKSGPTIGRISVTSNAAAEIVAVLPAGDTTAGIKYQKVQLYPAPDQIYRINVVYYKEPFRLVNDNDIHELGQEFDECIILLATSKLQGEQSKKDVETFAALFANELRVLRRKNADKLDHLPRRGRPSQAFNGRGGFGSGHGPHPWLSYQQFGSKYGPSGWYSGRGF